MHIGEKLDFGPSMDDDLLDAKNSLKSCCVFDGNLI
jgi:hypothetical protein